VNKTSWTFHIEVSGASDYLSLALREVCCIWYIVVLVMCTLDEVSLGKNVLTVTLLFDIVLFTVFCFCFDNFQFKYIYDISQSKINVN